MIKGLGVWQLREERNSNFVTVVGSSEPAFTAWNGAEVGLFFESLKDYRNVVIPGPMRGVKFSNVGIFHPAMSTKLERMSCKPCYSNITLSPDKCVKEKMPKRYQ